MALLAQCSAANNTTTSNNTNSNTRHITTSTNATSTKVHTPDSTPTYITVSTDTDKKRVESLLTKYANHNTDPQKLIIAIAREFKGVPYVAKTLENDTTENLVINTRQLDCTTYVENVVAIYECIKKQKLTFNDYCSMLREIRYVGGKVSYPARQHYFSEWIDENTKDGFVKEIQSPNPPFTAVQRLNINFMSTHTSLYPMLKNNPEMVAPIAKMEKRLSGNTYRYIPKGSIANNQLFRSTIHDGDIIAITTSKGGLDTSHIGIAVWHKDGLHMLNASQIHKKVVEEPMTLHQYMQKHPSQTGIRIVRVE